MSIKKFLFLKFLNNSKNNKNNNKQLKNNYSNKIIVCIGGGTGLFSLLSGLKELVYDRNIIKAVVTTLDNGGSSGKLITQYGVLPPGDIRNCLVALSEETELLHKLFQYRFNEKLEKHNFGNLLITALNDITKDFNIAIKEASKILRVKGEVIPLSLEKNDLVAEFEDNSKIVGENEITLAGKKIKDLKLKKRTKPNKRVLEVISKADIILFGPGSLYTSILPHLLFSEVRDEINKNKKAKKVLITSVMSQHGETDGFLVSDFKLEIEKYLKGDITHIIANSHIPASSDLINYQKENKYPVLLDEENIKSCKIIKGDFIDENKIVRHDPKKLAKAVINLLR